MSVSSDSSTLILPQTKFDAFASTDVGRVGFLAEAEVSHQILVFAAPIAHISLISIFSEFQ